MTRAPVPVDPDACIDRKRLHLALCVAEPALAAFLGQDPAVMDKVAVEQMRYIAGGARTKVRRIVAALNGVDVTDEVANGTAWTDAPLMVPRALMVRIRTALSSEKVFEAVASEVGQDEAAALLGELAGI